MTIVDSVYFLCILTAHVVRMAGRIPFEEKVALLRLVAFIASNPDDAVSLRGGRASIGGKDLSLILRPYTSPRHSILFAPCTSTKQLTL